MINKVAVIALAVMNLLFISVQASANTMYSISDVRVLYGRGVEDAGSAKKLMELLSSLPQSDPLLLAYRGGADALLAKHSWNPYTKVDYLAKSMNTLNQAINADSSNAEIRFIRFSIQYYIPQFLGYSKNLNEDAHVIAENFSQLKISLDAKTLQGIAKFMINSGICTASDSKVIFDVIE